MPANNSEQHRADRAQLPELEPLRAELEAQEVPNEVGDALTAAFRLKHATNVATLDKASPAAKPTGPVRSKVTALAACAAGALALGVVWFNADSGVPAATNTVAARGGAQSKPVALRLSATGPIYTRMAVPVQTHSLASGPNLRFVNTLTYQHRNNLSRALFIQNKARN